MAFGCVLCFVLNIMFFSLFSHISEITERCVLYQISQLYIKEYTSESPSLKDMEMQDSSESKYFFITFSG